MNLNLEKFKRDILFLPLGGSGEIGLNCNLYHYNGKWLIVDMGVGFTSEIPGVDVVAPDIDFIKQNIQNENSNKKQITKCITKSNLEEQYRLRLSKCY